MQILSHQGVTCRGRSAILSKLEEVARQQQQCQQHQHQQQPNSSPAGQPAWQLTNVDRQSLLQVRSSGSRVGQEVFSESAQSSSMRMGRLHQALLLPCAVLHRHQVLRAQPAPTPCACMLTSTHVVDTAKLWDVLACLCMRQKLKPASTSILHVLRPAHHFWQVLSPCPALLLYLLRRRGASSYTSWGVLPCSRLQGSQRASF